MWFTACLSPDGGSAELLKQISNRQYTLISSSYVIAEVVRNLQRKGTTVSLAAFFELFAAAKSVVAYPDNHQITQAGTVINAKEAPVLAAAKSADCDWLVTLDKRHFFPSSVTQFAAPMQIGPPGDVLATIRT